MQEEVPDLNTIPLKILSLETRNAISILFNSEKVIPTDNGLPRDWRGLAHLAGFKMEKIPVIQCDCDPTARVLTLWQKHTSVPCNIQKLKDFFIELDRFDALDDTAELIDKDVARYIDEPEKVISSIAATNDEVDHQILTVDDVHRLNQGLDTQTYDAFVVFADDDIDFATELIERMEKDYGMRLCVKERDLIAGVPFEHKAIIELISERCNRLIVILSPSFIKSAANKFVVNFAQALGIEQGKRKIVPCLFEHCELPQELKHYYMLDYKRSGRLWNFWDRLRDSIISPSYSTSNNSQLSRADHDEHCSEPLPTPKPALVQQDRSLKIKHSVTFASLSHLDTPDHSSTKYASANNLYCANPQTCTDDDSKTSIENDKKAKKKNWLHKLIKKDDKKENNDKDKKKKSWLKTKSKVAVAN